MAWSSGEHRGEGSQRKAGTAAADVDQRRARGRGPQRKAETVASVSTVKKMKLKKELRRRAHRKKLVKRAADPTTPPPARKAGLGAPVESPTLPSPDVEVLIKKIAKLRAEQGWWVEFSKLLVEDEHHKCDPAWSLGSVGRYARESLLWLKLMSERGVGRSRWVEHLAKERWGLSFADSDPWHDTQRQDCRAGMEEKTGTILIPRTRVWARAFVFGETTDDALQYAPSD